VLDEVRGRARRVDAARTRSLIREALEGHFTVPEQYHYADDSDRAQGERAERKQVRVKRRGSRSEKDGIITYGRHWIVLLQRTWWSVLLLLATIVGFVALATVNFFAVPIMIVGAFVVIVLEVGLIYFITRIGLMICFR